MGTMVTNHRSSYTNQKFYKNVPQKKDNLISKWCDVIMDAVMFWVGLMIYTRVGSSDLGLYGSASFLEGLPHAHFPVTDDSGTFRNIQEHSGTFRNILLLFPEMNDGCSGSNAVRDAMVLVIF